jgi:1,4-alpha-glucan branching enzyme
MIFMGQEFLEDKQWSDDPTSTNLINWDGVVSGDVAMSDFLHFFKDLIALRLGQPALTSDSVRVFHVHDQNRVIAFHRWVEDVGCDIVVVASLCEQTYYEYAIGFPRSGAWREIFNSDVYDGWVNPSVAGNGGAVHAGGVSMHGFDTSCGIVIPANGIVVFSAPA